MANQCAGLSASNIRYLLVIRELQRERKIVRSSDVAQALKVSRPSVHAMLESMKETGLLFKERRGSVSLTPDGQMLAEEYTAYYASVGACLEGMFPDEEEIGGVVCNILSEISRESLGKFCAREVLPVLG